MTFVHKNSNISQVVKDSERSGRGAISLILPNPKSKTHTPRIKSSEAFSPMSLFFDNARSGSEFFPKSTCAHCQKDATHVFPTLS
jgi:hypothetical protein